MARAVRVKKGIDGMCGYSPPVGVPLYRSLGLTLMGRESTVEAAKGQEGALEIPWSLGRAASWDVGHPRKGWRLTIGCILKVTGIYEGIAPAIAKNVPRKIEVRCRCWHTRQYPLNVSCSVEQVYSTLR